MAMLSHRRRINELSVLNKVGLVAASLAIVVAACGGSMTATEYVEGLNAIASRANALFEPVVVAYDAVEEPTLADEKAFLKQEIPIRRGLVEPFDALDPPESLTELHGLLSDLLVWQLVAAENLAPVAEAVSSLDELRRTSAFAEYEAANQNGSLVCLEVQSKLDDLAARPLIDNSWIPDLRLTVQAALGCSNPDTD
jgi:hypothetical protein